MKSLRDPSLLLVFTYAPAGLGHLRVLDALIEGLPEGKPPIILGANDKRIISFHRFTSIHPLARAIMEWFQEDLPEDAFTRYYRPFLRQGNQDLFQQMEQILAKKGEGVKTILIIATHFGLAHQLAAIKDKLVAELGVKIFLIVQVTDDSPQHIWYVPGADLIFVPSQKTKDELLLYGQTTHLPEVKFEVNSYPMSPVLIRELSKEDFKKKIDQLKFFHDQPINISLPISGAAVGLNFSQQLIKELSGRSPRFNFFVVSKRGLYTRNFLRHIDKYPSVKILASVKDHEVVGNYEKIFKENTFTLEITKPSEQAFKAILAPDKVGGVILLFASPIGRQEKDNLDFLRRHQFLPSITTQSLLEKTVLTGEQSQNLTELLSEASRWRGLLLPRNPKVAAEFVFQCLKLGVFEQMMKFKFSHEQSIETKHNGVEHFWETIQSVMVPS